MLDDQFFKQILIYEEKLINKTLEKDEMIKLIESYTKCVEQYDLKSDPIQIYFKDKIQTTVFLLSKVDKLWNDKDQVQSNPITNIRDTKAIYLEAMKGKENNQKNDYDYQKSQQANTFKMMLEIKKNKIDINKMIDDFEEIQMNNNQILFDDLEEQVNKLKSSLENSKFQNEEQVIPKQFTEIVKRLTRISQKNRSSFINPLNIQQELQLKRNESVQRTNNNMRRLITNEQIDEQCELEQECIQDSYHDKKQESVRRR